MHDPNTLAFRVRVPFFGWEIAEIWHVDPQTDGSDDSAGWFTPKMTEAQKKRFEWLAKSLYEDVGKPRSYQLPHTALEAIWWIWRCVKWEETKRRELTRDELDYVFSLAANGVDNLRLSVKNMADPDDCRHLVRCVYNAFLRHHRPWYRHPRWNFRRWQVRIPALKIKFGRSFGDVEMDW